MHIQVIVSRKDATNMIKLSPMNTSRGKNEEHSKKMGQFDRVAFKQSGESLFDSLFDFDRQLKETMAYANVQKNGSMHERMQMNTMEQENSLSSENMRIQEIFNNPITDFEKWQETLGGYLQINLTDDVDDEAVYGKNRHHVKPLGR